jgi:hypothetical protein
MIVYDSLGWQVPGRSRIEPAAHLGSCSCCTTRQQHNTTLAAVSRGSPSVLADRWRLAVLRLSNVKLVHTGKSLLQKIAPHGDFWQRGVATIGTP